MNDASFAAGRSAPTPSQAEGFSEAGAGSRLIAQQAIRRAIWAQERRSRLERGVRTAARLLLAVLLIVLPLNRWMGGPVESGLVALLWMVLGIACGVTVADLEPAFMRWRHRRRASPLAGEGE